MEQPISGKADISVTNFRKDMKKFLQKAREDGSITISQGGVRFHIVPTKNCTEKKLGFLYY